MVSCSRNSLGNLCPAPRPCPPSRQAPGRKGLVSVGTGLPPSQHCWGAVSWSAARPCPSQRAKCPWPPGTAWCQLLETPARVTAPGPGSIRAGRKPLGKKPAGREAPGGLAHGLCWHRAWALGCGPPRPLALSFRAALLPLWSPASGLLFRVQMTRRKDRRCLHPQRHPCLRLCPQLRTRSSCGRTTTPKVGLPRLWRPSELEWGFSGWAVTSSILQLAGLCPERGLKRLSPHSLQAAAPSAGSG